ncbi:MAG TPA: YbfB/YjiJ family MFS transporter [Alphaproteobacteria bacterium]|nr:YbfB/YjiJ family MFS transporter [Alphaproteobacteria bacterium]
MAQAALAAGHHGEDMTVWRATFAGLSANLIGIGLGRFAYTPLLPAVIAAGWLSPGQAAYIGAANLAGYLAGAVIARPLAARYPVASVLRVMMLLGAASFFACGFPLSFWWFFVWRAAAGIAGAVLMVLAAPAVLPLVPAGRRGLASGLMFTGIGIGVILAGTLVPLLLRGGLAVAWGAIGALGLALTIASWRGWPQEAASSTNEAPAAATRRPAALRLALPVIGFYLAYALDAWGIVPHMVFLADFVARGLGQGVAGGAHAWVLFGIGSVIGPTVSGYIGDRIGFGAGLRLAFVFQAGFVALLAVSDTSLGVAASAIVVGALAPGIAPLALGRAHELIDDTAGRQAVWRLATVCYAIGQAIAGYVYSFLLDQGAGYPTVFLIAAGTLVAALVVDIALSLRAHPARRPAR